MISASGIIDLCDVRCLDAFLWAAVEVGSLRILIDATGFEGMTGAAESDASRLRGHDRRRMRPIAVIAPVKWHGDFAVLQTYLKGINGRTFFPNDRETALAWLAKRD